MAIHVLVHGLPICGFSHELPCNWPLGHKWVRAEEHSDATCSSCRKLAMQAFPPKRAADNPPLVIPSECADEPPGACIVPSDEDEDWEYNYGYI